MSGTQDRGEAFQQQIELLLSLHRLFMARRADAPEADEIRERMESSWLQLSRDEMERIEEMSADLATLEPDSPIKHPAQGGILSEATRHKIEHLVERHDWIAALKYLTEAASDISSDTAAYLRGTGWLWLRHPEIALAFFLEARQRGVDEPSLQIGLLTCLLQLGRLDEAVSLAKQMIPTETRPVLLLKAAEVLSVAADRAESVDAAIKLRQEAAKIVEGTLGEAMRQSEADDVLAPLLNAQIIATCLHLALTYEELGNIQAAVKSCAIALKFAPDNPNAKLLQSWLERELKPKAAADMFRRTFSSQLATTTIMPADLALVSRS